MSIDIRVGIFKNHSLSQSGNVCIGHTIQQSRNQTKVNVLQSSLGDGIYYFPIQILNNNDCDLVDNLSNGRLDYNHGIQL